MNIFYSDSKIDAKLQYDYCIKFQLFKNSQDIFSRLRVLCCMLLPHMPQHYRRHVCGPSCSFNINFCGYLRFWALDSSEVYRYSMPLTTFLVNNFCLFHRPVLIFQTTLNCRASDKQRWAVSRTASLTQRTAQLLFVDI
jgi:hypothetical protein